MVRRRLQSRRSAAPTSAPSAAHAPIEVNAALPITKNPTADAAIVPVIDRAQPVPRRDDGQGDDRGDEQRAPERHDLTDDGERERHVGQDDGLGELARRQSPMADARRSRRSHPDRFAYAGCSSRRAAPGLRNWPDTRTIRSESRRTAMDQRGGPTISLTSGCGGCPWSRPSRR